MQNTQPFSAQILQCTIQGWIAINLKLQLLLWILLSRRIEEDGRRKRNALCMCMYVGWWVGWLAGWLKASGQIIRARTGRPTQRTRRGQFVSFIFILKRLLAYTAIYLLPIADPTKAGRKEVKIGLSLQADVFIHYDHILFFSVKKRMLG